MRIIDVLIAMQDDPGEDVYLEVYKPLTRGLPRECRSVWFWFMAWEAA